MKIRPSGISTRPVKNFRMTISRIDGDWRARSNRSGAGVRCVAVQTFTHFLAGLEKRHALLVDRHMRAGARIAAGTGGTMLDRKCAETAQLDPVATRQGRDDFIEDR